jgi:RND family efflux transporter MFP subunit
VRGFVIHPFFIVKPSSTLQALSSKSQEASPPGKRLPAWSIPAGILLGFSALFLILFGDRLLPAPKVDVAIVLATTADAKPINEPTAKPETSSPVDGAPMFQASGWIEPAPLPIKATALIDGVVDKVHVVAGDAVKQGQPLATLIADDARLAHAAAEHKHRTLQAALKAHSSTIVASEKKIAGLTAELAAAEARQAEAADKALRMERLPAGSVPEADVVSAKLNHEREIAQTASAAASVEQMRAEIDRLKAETEVKQGELGNAAVEVEQAALALRRTEITSPIDGRILRLIAAPGQKKMLQMDDPESSTIAILYQPDQLQVRVDVPLADAAGLQVGQSVRIHCSLLPDTTFQGKVTHIIGEADVQRNTLQAKVSITDPVEQLRPEMLCRVEFLESQTPSSSGKPASAASSLATWIPQSALADGAVWVCDSESMRVQKRTVTASGDTRDDYVRIDEGLRPGEWVVLSPSNLRDGKRVNPNLTEQP